MPPRADRSRNSNYEALNSQFLGRPQVPQGPSTMGDLQQLAPMGASSSTRQLAGQNVHQSMGLGHAQPYASMEPQLQESITVDHPFIPDIPVSLLEDPQCKMLLKGSLTKLAKEAAPGARLEDDAAELLLYVANDFLSGLANFSCRLASHRGGENLDARDVELYLEQMHGMRISLAASPPLDPLIAPSDPLTPPPTSAPTRKRERSPPLAQTRPRRHTNAAPLEEDEDDDEEDEEGEEGTEGGDDAEEDESDEEKPRESRRLRERAIAAEKQVKKGKRGKVGRPRK